MIEHLAGAAPEDVQATFCAALVDTWVNGGVRHAVVAPGSRSTPMAVAIADRPELQLHVVHDERVAGFMALGIGSAGAGPALLLCTSGTAAANFLPAVAEAGLSEIPMIVLTADRPPELRGVGAPQTIDQLDLYGRHAVWFRDAPVPDAAGVDGWRPLALDGLRAAAAGPAHLNLPFREPLLGTPGALPPPASGGEPEHRGDRRVAGDPSWDVQRGVVLAGGAAAVDPAQVAELHRRTQWPIIADPTSGLRELDGVVTAVDALLRHERFAADHAPDLVVRIGRPAASKLLAQWSGRAGLRVLQVGGPGRIDPAHNVVAEVSLADLLTLDLRGATGTTWPTRWRHAEAAASTAIGSVLDGRDDLTEPGVARLVAERLPAGADLVVSSSMPVRDLEWYGGRRARAYANRGANGIDGVVSTALGRASASPARPTFVLIGDLAFVHDTNALVALADRGLDLRIVVVDNDGGGIFSFLPQATRLASDRFERLFGTPLGADVLALAAAHRIATATATTRSELAEVLERPGPWVCRVPSDRAANVAVHAELHAAVAAAL